MLLDIRKTKENLTSMTDLDQQHWEKKNVDKKHCFSLFVCFVVLFLLFFLIFLFFYFVAYFIFLFCFFFVFTSGA